MGRTRFDPADLDPVDPFELDPGNVPHLHKHGFTPDDLYDVWGDPDAVFLPARPGGGAHWLLVGEVPADRCWWCRWPPLTAGKARPIGIYPAGVQARARYLENRR